MNDKTKNTSEIREYTDDKGKFKEGNPGKPKGAKNKYTIDKLIEAIEAEEAIAKEEDAPGLFQMFARMAYRNPNVMISLMNKFIANKEKLELSVPEPVNINIKRVKND